MHYCKMKNQCMVIRLPQEIDHYETDLIRMECNQMLLQGWVRDVVMDFSHTAFMDSSGIGLILGRLKDVAPCGGHVYLFGGNELISKMWKMSGILSCVTVLENIEEMKEVCNL